MENQEKDELIVETTPVTEASVEGAGRSGNSGNFFRNLANDNRKLVTYVLGALMLVIVGVFAYRYFYQQPREEEAQNFLFKPQRIFEQDSFNLALRGNGNDIIGMQTIADDYSGTESGNLANFYAGRALMDQGKYQEAIDYLEDFSTKSEIVGPEVYGLIGDCYSQLKDYDEAASYYQKAADKSENEFTTPMFLKKAGLVYEELGQPDKAAKAYRKIKEKYKTSTPGGDIDKFLARAEAAAGETE
jgi:tetratricopeptide (TPR) repeat protein